MIAYATSYSTAAFLDSFTGQAFIKLPILTVGVVGGLVAVLLLIVLIFFKGEKGENEYGPNPLDEYGDKEETPKTP